MILSLAVTCAMLHIAKAPTVIELPDSKSDVVAVEAVVSGGPEAEAQYSTWRVLGETLLAGTRRYTRSELEQFGSQAGMRPLVDAMPQHMRIRFLAPKGGIGLIVGMVTSVLREPELAPEEITASIERLSHRSRSPWECALVPIDLQPSKIRMIEVSALFRKTFSPNRVTIAVAGAFEPGEAKKLIEEEYAQPMEPAPRMGPPRVLDKPLGQHEEGMCSVDWVGPVVTKDQSLASTVLIAVAFGVGKESTLFRVLRQKHGFSYQQEALLWPESNGLRLRLLALRKDPNLAGVVPATMAAEIKADIASWSEQHLGRAKAIARSSLTGNGEMNPIVLGTDFRPGNSVADGAAFVAYMTATGRPNVDLRTLEREIEDIDLSTLKATAAAFMDVAFVRVIRG